MSKEYVHLAGTPKEAWFLEQTVWIGADDCRYETEAEALATFQAQGVDLRYASPDWICVSTLGDAETIYQCIGFNIRPESYGIPK